MAIDYEIDKERRIVFCTASDVCTIGDGFSLHERLRSDGDFDPSFSQLMDFTSATEGGIDANEIRLLAGSSPFSKSSRRAIVTNSQLGFGFARMFEILSSLRDESRVRVFRDRDKALAWLQSKKTG